MPVSVPEKTLEHWASQYLLSEYNAALWWPAFGEDIDIRRFPARPGKAVQLELKTATVKDGESEPVVKVNRWQLWNYLRSADPQPFYVFPRPTWKGVLEDVAGPAVTDLGSRRGGQLWFGNWLFAITATDAAKVLEVKADDPAPPRNSTRQLVRFTSCTSAIWGSLRTSYTPELIPWQDLWKDLAGGSRYEWPQAIHIPSILADRAERSLRERPARPSYRSEQITSLLHQVDDFIASSVTNEQFVTFVSDEQGRYWRAEDGDSDAGRPTVELDNTHASDSHRVLVFLTGFSRDDG